MGFLHGTPMHHDETSRSFNRVFPIFVLDLARLDELD